MHRGPPRGTPASLMNPTSESRKNDWRNVDADRYHTHTGEYANRVDRRAILEFIEGHSGVALDLPCGSGRMTRVLRAKYRTVSADYSPTMLEFASNDPDFVGARVDAFHLGFVSDSFDLIHCLRLSFHYANFERMLAEFHRVLKPGGILIFDSLNPWTLRWLLSFPLDLIRGKDSRSVHFRSKSELAKMLQSQGFEVVRTENRYLIPTRFYQYLPSTLQTLLSGMEKILPRSIRVLTYWKVLKPKGAS